MTLKALVAKRDEVKNSFDQQATIKANAENEMIRLQAQYQLMNQLIEADEAKTKKKAGA